MSWEIRQGDALDRLRELPDESVQCCVTSPPYFGLRDYGVDGQIGLEETLDAYLSRLVEVFTEVRRVLRSDGTLWLNIGDSYAGSWKAQGQVEGNNPMATRQIAAAGRKKSARTGSIPKGADYKAKDLMMVPAQLALALRRDGWWLRSEVIWAKKNGMPESVTDRPTRAHEQLYLLARCPRYFYDADAVRQKDRGRDHARNVLHRPEPTGGLMSPHTGLRTPEGRDGAGANLRTVWHLPTRPYPSAHFATFPTDLVEPCILAGSRGGDLVLDPFAGAATTGVVATRLDRDFLGIELNPEYVELGRRRILDDAPLLNADAEAAAA